MCIKYFDVTRRLLMLTTLKALKDIITKKDVKTKKIFDKISVGVKSRKKE